MKTHRPESILKNSLPELGCLLLSFLLIKEHLCFCGRNGHGVIDTYVCRFYTDKTLPSVNYTILSFCRHAPPTSEMFISLKATSTIVLTFNGAPNALKLMSLD